MKCVKYYGWYCSKRRALWELALEDMLRQSRLRMLSLGLIKSCPGMKEKIEIRMNWGKHLIIDDDFEA
jgi:hypothetical protein